MVQLMMPLFNSLLFTMPLFNGPIYNAALQGSCIYNVTATQWSPIYNMAIV